MRKTYTPNNIRALAKQSGPQWESEVRAALVFAADLLDAADAAVKSTQPLQTDAPRVPMTFDEVEAMYHNTTSRLTFARAIEAHHKIGIKP